MAYRFRRGDESVQHGLRRIAADQIDKAIAEVDDRGMGAAATVHQLRKRCKKLRGLIRLVRPAFGDYGEENALFRDAAAGLSGLRDMDAQIETYDALLDSCDGNLDRRTFAPVRRRLTLRRKRIVAAQDLDASLAAFRARMVAAKERAAHWTLDADGFDAVAGGLRKTYARAGKAMAKAGDKPTAENFHEWRKRAKYHWYHTRLLAPVWPGPMTAHRDAAKRLGDMLGEHHDLAVFRDTIAGNPGDSAAGETADALFALIERRQAALADDAFRLGARLLAEPGKPLARRWESYWKTWRAECA